ncbi:MAG: transposase [Deltaproteobacteria bacterium]|nr:MAG: transposase [Deltaproteobacteria bacterium]
MSRVAGSAPRLVSRHLLRGATQEGHLGAPVSAENGRGELPNGLDAAAQAAILRSGLAPDPVRCLKGAVEADEAYVGGHRPGRLGRGVGKTGVAIAVERRARTAGAVRLAVIPRATTAALTSFVYASVHPEQSTVFTDAWGALCGTPRPRNRPPPAQGRLRSPVRPPAALRTHRFREPEDLVARNLPRRQLEAPPALPRRVRLPLRSPLAGDRAFHSRRPPRRRCCTLSLPPTHGGANRIGRGRSSSILAGSENSLLPNFPSAGLAMGAGGDLQRCGGRTRSGREGASSFAT